MTLAQLSQPTATFRKRAHQPNTIRYTSNKRPKRSPNNSNPPPTIPNIIPNNQRRALPPSLALRFPHLA